MIWYTIINLCQDSNSGFIELIFPSYSIYFSNEPLLNPIDEEEIEAQHAKEKSSCDCRG